MAQNTIRKLTSEPTVFLVIGLSLVLIVTLFNDELGTQIFKIYGAILLLDFIIFTLFQDSDVRSISGNSAQALLYAGIALVGMFVLYQFVQFMFRQSILPIEATQAQLTQSMFSTIYQSFAKFGTVDIDFSKFTIVKYYLFGFLVAIQETRLIARLYGALARLANTSISNFGSYKTWSLLMIVSGLFTLFHLKVRGVNNNIDLAMTFLFAIVSLYLVGRFREIESANYLHISWNTLALILGR